MNPVDINMFHSQTGKMVAATGMTYKINIMSRRQFLGPLTGAIYYLSLLGLSEKELSVG